MSVCVQLGRYTGSLNFMVSAYAIGDSTPSMTVGGFVPSGLLHAFELKEAVTAVPRRRMLMGVGA
jgi:hypothetical protein